MTTYEIRVVDPTDEAALRAWWEVGRDATAERPMATHRRVLEPFPGCAYGETGNPGVNAATGMANHRLGHRAVERCLDVQKVL